MLKTNNIIPLLRNSSSLLSLLLRSDTKSKFRINPSLESTGTRQSTSNRIKACLLVPSFPQHPALHILQTAARSAGCHRGMSPRGPLRSFLFCRGFPTAKVNSSIIHPAKRALPFCTLRTYKEKTGVTVSLIYPNSQQ